MIFFCPTLERGSEAARCWYWTWGEIKRYYNGSDTKLVLVPTCESSFTFTCEISCMICLTYHVMKIPRAFLFSPNFTRNIRNQSSLQIYILFLLLRLWLNTVGLVPISANPFYFSFKSRYFLLMRFAISASYFWALLGENQR